MGRRDCGQGVRDRTPPVRDRADATNTHPVPRLPHHTWHSAALPTLAPDQGAAQQRVQDSSPSSATISGGHRRALVLNDLCIRHTASNQL